MEAGKAFVIRVLSWTFGYEAEDILTSVGRRADLRIADAESIYHIEVKEKCESVELAAKRAAVLASGELYEQSDELAYHNRIGGIIRDASEQLSETPKDNGTFQLIWFHANGIDADAKARQAMATFYGQVALSPRWDGSDIETWRESQPAELPTCFYFDYAASYALQNIEGLFISDAKGLQLCLNEFSLRLEEFRNTELYRKAVELGCVCDPVALANRGEIIACRAAIPRKDDNAIAQALKEQTGILYSPIRLTRHSYSIAMES